MFQDGGDAEERTARPASPVTMILLAANAAVFLFQYYVLPRIARDAAVGDKFIENYALSVEGLRAGHLWQLLTYQFMHGSLLHIFANSWAIYVFGRVAEEVLGKWRMLAVYFLSGIAGGLVEMLGSWAWPHLFGEGPVIGASAAAYGLVAGFVALFPTQRLLILLFLIIPISMRARTMLRVCVGFSVVGIFYPFLQPLAHRYLPLPGALDAMFLHIGHAAHLGGMATGFLLALWMRRGIRMRRLMELRPKGALHITHAPE
jgi:membrane associated rhomboid family serine protease